MELVTREEALELLRSHVKTPNLVKHCIAVGAIMEELARKLGEDEQLWMLTGLLHDIDYEETKNDMSRHGLVAGEMLEGKLPEDAVSAIRAHNTMTGHVDESRLALALRASDALSGLVVATALVMPDRKLASVKPESIAKKYKQKDFARNVERDEIALCERLGLSLDEFFAIGLEGCKRVARELGL